MTSERKIPEEPKVLWLTNGSGMGVPFVPSDDYRELRTMLEEAHAEIERRRANWDRATREALQAKDEAAEARTALAQAVESRDAWRESHHDLVGEIGGHSYHCKTNNPGGRSCNCPSQYDTPEDK